MWSNRDPSPSSADTGTPKLGSSTTTPSLRPSREPRRTGTSIWKVTNKLHNFQAYSSVYLSCIVGYFCCLICQPSKLNHKSSCHGQYQVQDIYKCRHANPKQVFKAPDHYKCYWYSYIHAYKRIEKLNPTKKTERTKKKTLTSLSSTKGKLDF